MKNKKTITLFTAVMAFMLLAFSFESNAQNVKKRLPDGTIIYTDGSIKKPTGEVINPNPNGTRLPDGTIIFPNGKTYPGSTTQRFPNRGVRQADGSILYPDGRIKYPDGSVRYPDGRVVYPNSENNRDGKRLPPGQAKKKYGSKSAREYAPGHNKNKNKEHDRDDDDDDHDDRKDHKNHKQKKNKNHDD